MTDTSSEHTDDSSTGVSHHLQAARERLTELEAQRRGLILEASQLGVSSDDIDRIVVGGAVTVPVDVSEVIASDPVLEVRRQFTDRLKVAAMRLSFLTTGRSKLFLRASRLSIRPAEIAEKLEVPTKQVILTYRQVRQAAGVPGMPLYPRAGQPLASKRRATQIRLLQDIADQEPEWRQAEDALHAVAREALDAGLSLLLVHEASGLAPAVVRSLRDPEAVAALTPAGEGASRRGRSKRAVTNELAGVVLLIEQEQETISRLAREAEEVAGMSAAEIARRYGVEEEVVVAWVAEPEPEAQPLLPWVDEEPIGLYERPLDEILADAFRADLLVKRMGLPDEPASIPLKNYASEDWETWEKARALLSTLHTFEMEIRSALEERASLLLEAKSLRVPTTALAETLGMSAHAMKALLGSARQLRDAEPEAPEDDVESATERQERLFVAASLQRPARRRPAADTPMRRTTKRGRPRKVVSDPTLAARLVEELRAARDDYEAQGGVERLAKCQDLVRQLNDLGMTLERISATVGFSMSKVSMWIRASRSAGE